MKNKLNESSKYSNNLKGNNEIQFPMNQKQEAKMSTKYFPKNISILYQHSIKSKLNTTIKNWMNKLFLLKKNMQKIEKLKAASDSNDFGNFINYKQILKKNQ